ncbi:hypothetical protein B0H16DRAFT_1845425 [Mycena metata]|uniref:Uncharacterized protein n=1 Tax=Mycena metata TaxID=1033252 RepID=A0AAD7N7X5_9AGAR|nr:hypothetical protein B0H16DRAFT_1845425 [Mycena metata]
MPRGGGEGEFTGETCQNPGRYVTMESETLFHAKSQARFNPEADIANPVLFQFGTAQAILLRAKEEKHLKRPSYSYRQKNICQRRARMNIAEITAYVPTLTTRNRRFHEQYLADVGVFRGLRNITVVKRRVSPLRLVQTGQNVTALKPGNHTLVATIVDQDLAGTLPSAAQIDYITHQSSFSTFNDKPNFGSSLLNTTRGSASGGIIFLALVFILLWVIRKKGQRVPAPELKREESYTRHTFEIVLGWLGLILPVYIVGRRTFPRLNLIFKVNTHILSRWGITMRPRICNLNATGHRFDRGFEFNLNVSNSVRFETPNRPVSQVYQRSWFPHIAPAGYHLSEIAAPSSWQTGVCDLDPAFAAGVCALADRAGGNVWALWRCTNEMTNMPVTIPAISPGPKLCLDEVQLIVKEGSNEVKFIHVHRGVVEGGRE